MSEQENLFSGYEEIKAGEQQETTVSEIKSGPMSSFKTPAYFEAVDKDKRELAKNQPAVQIICANGCRMEMGLPQGKRYGPRSTLAAWMHTYRDFPKVGMTVQTERDDAGFFRIQLKQLR